MSQYFTCAVAGSLTRLRLTEDVVGAGDAHAAVLLLGGSALYTRRIFSPDTAAWAVSALGHSALPVLGHTQKSHICTFLHLYTYYQYCSCSSDTKISDFR